MSAGADEPTANFQRTEIVSALIRETQTAEAVGALIRDARKALKLKQERVTELTGIGMTAIYHIESGTRKGSDGKTAPYTTGAATLVKLARALNITAAQLEDVGRSDAAVMLLTEHLNAGGLDESERRQLIALLRKLSATLTYAETIEWMGIATGQLTPKRTDELTARDVAGGGRSR